MATIVREARDPWWANLAVNVLGGLWNDYQQREQNKKLHALEGEIASAISGLSGGQDTDTDGGLIGNAGSNFGAVLGSTGGITGGNGWENAFHQSDNPLAEYDANMAGIAPTAQAQGQATPTQATAQAAPVTAITRRQPTSQEILNAFAGLMSSKRFSGVNPKAAQDLPANSQKTPSFSYGDEWLYLIVLYYKKQKYQSRCKNGYATQCTENRHVAC